MTMTFKSGRLTSRDLANALPNTSDSLPWPQPSEPQHIGTHWQAPARGWREELIERQAAYQLRKEAEARRGWLVSEIVGVVLLVGMVVALCVRSI